MNRNQLALALRNKAAEVRRVNVTTAHEDQLLRDAADLLRVLSHLVVGKTADKAFGPPGDWGYDTPIGQALSSSEAEGRDKVSLRPDILTASGNYFNFIEPQDNAVLVTDIAHALANVCRFGGHTREFYSVAQHSVLASEIVAPELALAALFHDATEAYIGDVTRPLKNLLPDYRAIEARLHADIFRKLGLPEELPAEVKTADLILLATEQRDLMPEHDDVWALIATIDPLPDSIVPWSPNEAEEYFLERYRELVSADMPGRIGALA
jgi:uncharacterized protein